MASNDAVQALREHPLNKAAIICFEKMGVKESELPPETMPVLVLAISHQAEKDESNQRFLTMGAWVRTPTAQRNAVTALEQQLRAEEMLQGTPEQAAELVLCVLAPTG